jgi:hypothetical protein
MNRAVNDYFEGLLYKVFVSVDERTTIAQLASLLQIDTELVKVCTSLNALGYPCSFCLLNTQTHTHYLYSV